MVDLPPIAVPIKLRESELIRPNVVSMFGAKSHTGTAIEPQPSPFRLLYRHFEALVA